REDGALLTVRQEPQRESPIIGQMPRGLSVRIVDQQGNTIPLEELGQSNLLTETWFQVRGEGADGQPLEGWSAESRIRVLETDENGVPVAGSVRPRLGSTADPLTQVYAEPNESSETVGAL